MNFSKYLSHPIFELASQVCNETGLTAYVIGGFVRDCLLNRKKEKQDIDIVVIGSGIEFAQKLAKKAGKNTNVSVFKNFGTAMLRYQGIEVEFVGARKESYRGDSRKPIVEDGTLEDDQQRRDFTINAMAICLAPAQYGEFLDPFNGMHDLENRIIRTPLEPDKTFSDDPLRMMRAIRFASQLNFEIEPACFDSITQQAERLKIVSSERIIDEFNKIMMCETPSRGLFMLEHSGLLNIFFPELQTLKGDPQLDKGHKEIFTHTLKVLDNICPHTQDLWLRWAALLHDIGKPATKKYVPGIGWTFYGHDYIGSEMVPSIFRRLKLPMNEKMKYVQKLVALHLRPIALAEDIVSDSAVRRLLFEAGEDVDDLMTLCEADITTGNHDKYKLYLKNFELVRLKLVDIEAKDKIRNFQPPVTGEEIMQYLNLSPCKNVGILKTLIKDAILEGKIPNEHDAAFTFMIDEAKKMGLVANPISK